MKHVHCKDLLLNLTDYNMTAGGVKLIAETVWNGQKVKASFSYFKGQQDPMAMLLVKGGDVALVVVNPRFYSTPLAVLITAYSAMLWS